MLCKTVNISWCITRKCRCVSEITNNDGCKYCRLC